MSDNDVDLSENYVDLSDIKLTSRLQLWGIKTLCKQDINLLVLIIIFWQVDIMIWQVNIKIWQVDIIIWQVMAEIWHHTVSLILRTRIIWRKITMSLNHSLISLFKQLLLFLMRKVIKTGRNFLCFEIVLIFNGFRFYLIFNCLVRIYQS